MTDFASLDSVLSASIAQGRIPGVAAVLTNAQGNLYAKAFGTRKADEPGLPMQLDTVAWIASMTKAITSTAAVKLADEGKLSLDAPARQWFEPLGNAKVLEGFDDAGQPILRAPRREVTLRHLLTHTAGYGYEFFSADMLRFQQATGTPGVISCANAVFNNPLLFDPGERWNYGISTEFVGKIIEAVTGQRLGEHLRESLLEPLGMHDTAFRLSENAMGRLASVHRREKDGSLSPRRMLIEQNPEFEMGGGGLYSTAQDYAKFLRLFLNQGQAGGQRLLSDRALELLTRNALQGQSVVPLASSIPAVTHDLNLYPGVQKQWSLAFQINAQPLPTGRSAGSLMWAGLANSYFWLDLQRGIGGVYITQVVPFLDPSAVESFMAFETAAYQLL